MRKPFVAIYDNTAGKYLKAIPIVYTNGTWNQCIPNIYVNNTWTVAGAAGTLMITLLDNQGDAIYTSNDELFLVKED